MTTTRINRHGAIPGFAAEHSGGDCPRCRDQIQKGDRIVYNEDKRVQHVDCELDPSGVDSTDTVFWGTTGESIDRMARADIEAEQLAPLQRPVCNRCNYELPVSMVCGSC